MKPIFNNLYRIILFLTICLTSPEIVKGQLIADFSFNIACYQDTTYFLPISPNSGAINYCKWDFGDGSFAIFNTFSPCTHVFPGYGPYSVTLDIQDTNNQFYTVTHLVDVQNPIPDFTFTAPNCQNEAAHFTDLSTTNAGTIEYWIWDFGDGSPSDTIGLQGNPNASHIFPLSGTYQVTLTIITNVNCSRSITKSVLVPTVPIANFSFMGMCKGEHYFFSDLSITNGNYPLVSWDWNFGDPASGINNTSNLTNPSHFYSSQGTYPVRLVVTNSNNCKDTINRQVQVYPMPEVDFSHSSPCLNQPVYFEAIANINSTALYYWEFGDGNTAMVRNTMHFYSQPGAYTARLTITDTVGCSNRAIKTIIVHQSPEAEFQAENSMAGLPVNFVNLSLATTGYIVSWSWNFGDGSTSFINFPDNPNVSHTYSQEGDYLVTLTVQDNYGCTDSKSILLHIDPLLQPDFTFNSPACEGSLINFTDLSQPGGSFSIVNWLWNFGDPASGILNQSALQNPSHLFSQPGMYSVRLIVFNSNNNSDTITKPVTVTPLPVVTIDPVSVNSILSGESTYIQFSSGIPGIEYCWTAECIAGSVSGFSASCSNVGLITDSLVLNGSQPGVVKDTVSGSYNGCIGTEEVFKVTVLPSRVIHLTLFLESLYNGNATMRNAMGVSGPEFGESIADKINVEFHSPTNYANILHTLEDVSLMTDGTATLVMPVEWDGSYYLTIRHRNSVATTSASPVLISVPLMEYHFNQPSEVYGTNLLNSQDGQWLIFGGDVNQDGILDSADMTLVESHVASFATGYLQADVNGDRIMDSRDMIIVDNNVSRFVSAIHP